MMMRPDSGTAATSFLGADLSTKLQKQLDNDFGEDVRIDGSAVDELQLALDTSELITRLGGTLSDADVRALCEVAYKVNHPSMSREVMIRHPSVVEEASEELSSPAEE
eukprot:2833445-Amphidinium_carterae.1